MPRVIGLDLSLRSTGIGLATATMKIVPSGVTEDAPLEVRMARMEYVLAGIEGTVQHEHDLTHAVVEGPSYASKGGREHERGGLWWSAVMLLKDLHLQVWVASPKTIKKYATGNGNADKAEMVAATKRWAPWFTGKDDEADAWWACAMGTHRTAEPLVPIPSGPRSEAYRAWLRSS